MRLRCPVWRVGSDDKWVRDGRLLACRAVSFRDPSGRLPVETQISGTLHSYAIPFASLLPFDLQYLPCLHNLDVISVRLSQIASDCCTRHRQKPIYFQLLSLD